MDSKYKKDREEELPPLNGGGDLGPHPRALTPGHLLPHNESPSKLKTMTVAILLCLKFLGAVWGPALLGSPGSGSAMWLSSDDGCGSWGRPGSSLHSNSGPLHVVSAKAGLDFLTAWWSPGRQTLA